MSRVLALFDVAHGIDKNDLAVWLDLEWPAADATVYASEADYLADLRELAEPRLETLAEATQAAVNDACGDSNDEQIDSLRLALELALGLLGLEMPDPQQCAACRELIRENPVSGEWLHQHSEDIYCGTGDGAVALPIETPIQTEPRRTP